MTGLDAANYMLALNTEEWIFVPNSIDGEKYTPILNDVPEFLFVTIDDGISDLYSIIVDETGKITKPEDPVLEGYVFKGWTDAKGNEVDFNAEVSSITMYKAVYEEIFTVVIDGVSQEVVNGNLAVISINTSKEGYNFLGYITEDGTMYDIENEVITDDLILNLLYEKIENHDTGEDFSQSVESNPDTSDNIVVFIALSVVSSLGMFLSLVVIYTKIKKKKLF